MLFFKVSAFNIIENCVVYLNTEFTELKNRGSVFFLKTLWNSVQLLCVNLWSKKSLGGIILNTEFTELKKTEVHSVLF